MGQISARHWPDRSENLNSFAGDDSPMDKLERRGFLKRAAAGAVGTGLLAGCSSGSDTGPATNEAQASGPSVNWRLATSFPASLDLLHGAAVHFSERVSALTGGRFSIRVFSAGEIVPGLQVMDAVQQGTVHAGYSAGYYYIGKNPALAFDSTIPFGLDTRQQLAWLHHGGGIDLMREIYADFGIRPFVCGGTGGQMGGWFRNPVNTVADLQGLRMRIPGIGGEIMSRLGATVQVLAGGEIYAALERGTIDATEWVGPYDDEELGFHEIAKNYYYPGWWEPGLTGSLQVGQEAWDSLPTPYQEVFQSAADETTVWMISSYDARNPAAIARLQQDNGVTLRPFSEEILTAAAQESEAFLQEQASQDATFRRVYDSWNTFRTQAFSYSAGNELAYASFAFPRG